MRRKFCLSLFVLFALAAFGGESRGQSVLREREFRPDRAGELTSLVWKLREVKEVSSSAVGFGSAKGEFFKLSEEILRLGSERDFEQMVGDENVVVKVMGLVCLAQLGGEHSRGLLRLHTTDGRPVRVAEGCVIYDTTVGKLARRLLAEPNFLGHGKKRAAEAGAAHD
jgi:hypothetical protein